MTTNGVPGPRPGHRSRITGATRVVPAPSSALIVIRSSRAFSTATTKDRVLWMSVSEHPVIHRAARPSDGAAPVTGARTWSA